MPQIKFSGLVTDMKGKGGGSVFASNRQGSYFRNNKWGGGRKSQRWDKAKNNLSFLSSQWKALTAEQRQAWNDAAVNFPFYNKFQVEYTPSGYQLFMSLQGNLLSNFLPLIDTPSNPRPAPNDLTILSTVPDVPWVTGGTGATFPSLAAGSTGNCYGSQSACPICFTCVGGFCTPITPNNTNGMVSCIENVTASLPQVSPNVCSTDQDCYDAGLGTGNDIECQNGECIYVGDGFLNWNQYAYGLNISSILRNNGNWNEEDDYQDTRIVGSFRITLGQAAKRTLQTTQNDVILVSNYQIAGVGLDIRLRQTEQGTTGIWIKLGVTGVDNINEAGTLVWYFDRPTSEFMQNTVIQFQINPAKTQEHKIAIGNSGWLPFQFGYFDNLITTPTIGWPAYTGTTNNPFSTWTTEPSYWGVVYGAGLFGIMTDCVYSDIRFWQDSYNDYLQPLIGYLNGSESILILANGDARPRCKYNSCEPNIEDNIYLNDGSLASDCDWDGNCQCIHGKCGKWGQRGKELRNAAPGGNPAIGCWPIVPIYTLNTPGDYDDGASFQGTWMQLDGAYFGFNGAVYNPNAILNISSVAESGWALTMFITKPKHIGSTVYDQEFIYSTTFSLGSALEINLWEFIKAAVSNVPLGSEVEIGFKIIDTNNGNYTQKLVRPRFKAGAELSSGVW